MYNVRPTAKLHERFHRHQPTRFVEVCTTAFVRHFYIDGVRLSCPCCRWVLSFPIFNTTCVLGEGRGGEGRGGGEWGVRGSDGATYLV
jgi:hypothetical protein